MSYRYYSTQRPFGPGTFPKKDGRETITNYDGPAYCEEIGREAWGHIEYPEPLTEKEALEYELTPAGIKIWYEVTVAWYSNGKIYAFVSGSIEAAEKPAGKSKKYKSKEISTYWYESHEAAEAAARKAMMV